MDLKKNGILVVECAKIDEIFHRISDFAPEQHQKIKKMKFLIS